MTDRPALEDKPFGVLSVSIFAPAMKRSAHVSDSVIIAIADDRKKERMGEYQYYEFQAVDRPLSDADRQALRALSTRARITATSLANHYEWGDFKGDPRTLMERWFDLHLYLANWGTRRLMMRLPKRLLDRSKLDPFLREVDWVEVWASGENLIVDMCRDEVEPDDEDWDDGSGWLAALAPLRADVLSGDMRLFYLLWLTAVEEGSLPDDEAEPLPRIAPLSGTLEAFAEFFDIDADLLAAAAERGAGDAAPSGEAARAAVAAIPEREKTALLLRLVEGDPHAAAELRSRIRHACAVAPVSCRTVGELRKRAEDIAEARERVEAERREAERRRQAEEAEKARRTRLEAVRRRGPSVWREIEDEIQRRNASGYDRAAALLFDLKAIAAEDGTLTDYARRLDDIRDRHARKERFLQRLKGLAER